MGSHHNVPFPMRRGGFPQGRRDSECCCRGSAVPGAGCSCENPTDVAWCLALGGIAAICSTVMLSQTVCKSSPVPQKCWRLKKAGGVKAFKGWDRFRRKAGKACFYSTAQVETKDFRCGLGTSHQYYIYS